MHPAKHTIRCPFSKPASAPPNPPLLLTQAGRHLPDTFALQGAQALLHHQYLAPLVQNKGAHTDLVGGCTQESREGWYTQRSEHS